MDLKEQDILGDRIASHWYYRSKGRAMLRFLGDVERASILDVGAGSGVFSRMLIDRGGTNASCCVDIGYADDSVETGPGWRIDFRRAIDGSDADLALLMDVLEHVEDDVGLLKSYADLLKPGAHVLITVPAFQALWSAHDVFLEHHRRYTLPQIEGVARAAGLEIVRGAYFFGGLLPLAALMRLKERRAMEQGALQPKSSLKLHHPVVNGLMNFVHLLELPFMRLNRLGGLSAFCLARKPATAAQGAPAGREPDKAAA